MSEKQRIDWEIKRVKIADLIGYKNNPRILTKEAHEKIKRSLDEDGFHSVLKVNKDGTIIGGNQRAKILQELGETEVDVKMAKRQLTQEECNRINLKDNKISGDWDFEMLANTQDLETLLECGFTEQELGDIKLPEVEEIESDEADDEAPETSKESKTVLGDVYELGNHRLMCGNSVAITDVEKLLDKNSVDLVYTDPPYGANIVKKKDGKLSVGGGGVVSSSSYEKILGDENTDTAIESFNLASTICSDLIFWGAEYYANALPPSRGWIVWDKDNTGDFGDAELAYTSFDKPIRIFKHMWNGMLKDSEQGQKRCHPTQKPIALAEWCFENYGKEAINVLDIFGGSGSTLIACENTERNCFMMELSPNYCDVIVQRWVDFRRKHGKDAVVKRNGEVIDF